MLQLMKLLTRAKQGEMGAYILYIWTHTGKLNIDFLSLL